MTVVAALLAVVVAFLVPLRLISLVLRLAYEGRGTSGGNLRRSCAALAVAGALLAVIFALPRDGTREGAAPVTITGDVKGEGRFHEELRSEVEQLKLQLARLESLWDENLKSLDAKGDALEEDGSIMRAIGLDVQSLINEQENTKMQMQESLCSSYFGNRIKAMENEVQVLKDGSRKMNSDIYNVLSVAKDTTKKVEALQSDIKKVQLITDKWGKMDMNRIWSFAKDTEKKVEDLYSDIKKGFKQTKRKVPFWRD